MKIDNLPLPRQISTNGKDSHRIEENTKDEEGSSKEPPIASAVKAPRFRLV